MFQSATMRLPPIACNISAVLFKSNLLRLFQGTAKCVRDREYLVDAVSSVELCLLWEVAREHLVHSERALISLRVVGFRYRSVDLKMIHLSRRAGFCPTAQIVKALVIHLDSVFIYRLTLELVVAPASVVFHVVLTYF